VSPSDGVAGTAEPSSGVSGDASLTGRVGSSEAGVGVSPTITVIGKLQARDAINSKLKINKVFWDFIETSLQNFFLLLWVKFAGILPHS
jgi:hypothetical protein